ARPRLHRRSGPRPGPPRPGGRGPPQARRRGVPQDHAGRPLGRRRGDGVGRRRAGPRGLRPRPARPRRRALHGAPALRRAAQPGGAPSRSRRDVRPRRPPRRPAAAGGGDGSRPARARRLDPGPAPARAPGPGPRPRGAGVGAVPDRARGQAVPPGLRPRSARALPHRGAGRVGDGLDVPGHRPRRRRGGSPPARHRQARGLHDGPRVHRDDGRRQAPRRDPSRLLPDPPGDRRPAGLPGSGRSRAPAHHPVPPRLARARLARGAVHARGDARALLRQPRRPPRLLRPAGEGAPRRRGLVGLRPGARRRRVLRARRGPRERTRGAAGGRGPRAPRAPGALGADPPPPRRGARGAPAARARAGDAPAAGDGAGSRAAAARGV
ncbi:MAG: hypothetical protein AVDCRST_MAG13-2690, partial [uncultured Solirubrobacteraceae bacterium]